MPSDMRDELVNRAAGHLVQKHDDTIEGDDCSMCGDYPRETASDVLDSIPPGSFKREDGTWVRLRAVQDVYTEVDHAE